MDGDTTMDGDRELMNSGLDRFQRRDLVKVILQSLESLGYRETLQCLERESGVTLFQDPVVMLRDKCLAGAWDEISDLLEDLVDSPQKRTAAKNLIFQTKYVELLLARRTVEAMSCLRLEVTPVLEVSSRELAVLSSLLVLSPNQVKSALQTQLSIPADRLALFYELQTKLKPELRMPSNRLADLLATWAEQQEARSVFARWDDKIGLLQDEEELMELETLLPTPSISLKEHRDEAWVVAFSLDGRYLATGGRDGAVFVYPVQDVLQKKADMHILELRGSFGPVSFLAWHPTDHLLLVCSTVLQLWDVQTGDLVQPFFKHTSNVECCAWMPDGEHFVSASLEETGRSSGSIILWNKDGTMKSMFYGFRVRDMGVVNNGQQLLVVDATLGLLLFPLSPQVVHQNYEVLAEGSNMSTIGLSLKHGHLACVLSGDVEPVLWVWDLRGEPRCVRTIELSGGCHVRRACFFGDSDSLVLCPILDPDSRTVCNVGLWDVTGRCRGTLTGHCSHINSLAQSPGDPFLFASASDDMTVKLWRNPLQAAEEEDRRE